VNRITITQVVPEPEPDAVSGALRWVEQEGYYAGRLAIEALLALPDESWGREAFLDALNRRSVFKIEDSDESVLGPYGVNCTQGMRAV